MPGQSADDARKETDKIKNFCCIHIGLNYIFHLIYTDIAQINTLTLYFYFLFIIPFLVLWVNHRNTIEYIP